MIPPLSIQLLGPLEVVDASGAAIEVWGSTQRLLLARLALSPGRVVPVPELIDALWSDDPPANAAGNLQSYLSRLRRMIGAPLVQHAASGYRLGVTPEATDIGRLDRLVTAVRRAREAEPATRAELLGDALALWRGDPLVEFAGVAVMDAERTRLSELRLLLLEDFLAVRMELGPVRDLLPDMEQAVVEHPERERLALVLMDALHRAGRTADALRVGAEHRRRSVETSGLEPSPAVATLEQRLLATLPAPVVPSPAGPAAERFAPSDRFVGRDGELAEVSAHLETRRLVSVVGPGGVGKTRLVQELLDRRSGDAVATATAPPPRTAEAHFVALAATASAAGVAPVVAASIGLRAAPEGHENAIVTALGPRRCLVVLDNCEHVIDGVAPLVVRLLAGCPELTLLTTSRRPLGLPSEQVVRLGALPADDGAALFCDRATRARSGFRPSPEERALIGDICSHVEGLPLAVELAARREPVFGVRQLAARLLEDLSPIAPVDAEGRRGGVGATIEWSRRLLDPRSRAVFDRLAVCRDGFTLHTVEHLAPRGSDATTALVDLVEASLVLADVQADPPRYRMLEVTRQAALTHLSEAERTDSYAAHARWARALAAELFAEMHSRPDATMAPLRRDRANLQAALAWSLEAGEYATAADIGLTLAFALADDPHLPLLEALRGVASTVGGATASGPPDADRRSLALLHVVGGAAEWLVGNCSVADQLLDAARGTLDPGDPHRPSYLYFHAMTKLFLGDPEAVESLATELVDTTARDWMRADAVCIAAMTNLFAGRRSAAERWMRDHADLLDQVSDVDGVVDYTRAELAADHDPEAALDHFAAAERLCDALGYTYNREIASLGRAAVLVRVGRHGEAVDECIAVLGRVGQLGMWPQAWTALRLSAELLVALGDPVPAATLLAAADVDELAPAVMGPGQEHHAALWAEIERTTGYEEASRARARGQRCGRHAALQLGLDALGRHR